MRQGFGGGLVVVALLTAHVGKGGEPNVNGRGQTNWLTDYGQARSLARATGRPIFLVFR